MTKPPIAGPRGTVRWSLWLLAGALAGVLAGFALGLARPRVMPARIGGN